MLYPPGIFYVYVVQCYYVPENWVYYGIISTASAYAAADPSCAITQKLFEAGSSFFGKLASN